MKLEDRNHHKKNYILKSQFFLSSKM